MQRYGKNVLPSTPPIPRELERKGVVLAIAREYGGVGSGFIFASDEQIKSRYVVNVKSVR